MPHCHTHTDTELVCPKCVAAERGRKGGASRSKKKIAAGRKAMAKINKAKQQEKKPSPVEMGEKIMAVKEKMEKRRRPPVAPA